jgi:hypothetical protein
MELQGSRRKLSLYRTGETLSVPGRWDTRISRQLIHKGFKFVSSTNRPPLPSMIPGTYLLEAQSIAGQ